MPKRDTTNSGSSIFVDRVDITGEVCRVVEDIVVGRANHSINPVKLFTKAISEVDEEYFRIATVKSPVIVRERAFCYELYHQAKLHLDRIREGRIRLHGEIDKRGHAEIEQNDWRNPDFILHEPGTMQQNLAIVEVKGDIRNKAHVEKDLRTLSTFLTKYGYKQGLLIIFGIDIGQTAGVIREILDDDNKKKESTRRGTISSSDPFSDLVKRKTILVVAPRPTSIKTFSLTDVVDI